MDAIGSVDLEVLSFFVTTEFSLDSSSGAASGQR